MIGDDDIEDWDDFEEVDLSKKKYMSDKNYQSHKERGLKSRLTQKEIIKRFRELHGDKFDYSKVDYQGDKKKVIIICPEHGEILINPRGHSRGRGCGKCGGLNLTTQDVLHSFKKMHGDRYDYSKVDYKDNKTKVIIICKEHGEFLLHPTRHMKVGRGCQKCGFMNSAKKHRSLDEVIQSFKEVHDDRYDYSKVNYINWKTKVRIICSEHGEFFLTSIKHKNGQGCPSCAKVKTPPPKV